MASSVPSVAEGSVPGPVGEQFPCLDAYRGIGMLMVMLFHVYFVTRAPVGDAKGFLGPLVARGDVGVVIFLVLSAFLLFRPYFVAQLEDRPHRSTRRFYRHRVLRIFPGYWLALTVVVIVFGATFTGLGEALSYYGLFQVYRTNQVLAPQFQPIYQSWSLAVELAFYLLLPAFALGLRRLGAGRPVRRQITSALVASAVVYIVGVAYRLWLVTARPSWERIGVLWLPNWLDILAIGLALATVSAWSRSRGSPPAAIAWLADRPAVCWTVALAVYLFVTRLPLPVSPTRISGSEYVVRQLCYGVLAAFFLLPGMFGDQQAGLIRRFLRHPVMTYLGTVSLGFYLLHLVFIDKAQEWTGRTFFNADFWTILVIALPLTLVAATLSYYLVERPFLLMKDRSPRAAWHALLASTR